MNFNFPKLSTPSIPDMRQISNEASSMFSRVRQYTEEKLGSAEKTEYDQNFEHLYRSFEKTRKWAETIKYQTEVAMHPNPNTRMEDFVYNKLDKKPPERPSNFENLGISMIEAGIDVGCTSTYGNILTRCGEAEIKVGKAEQMFLNKAVVAMLQPFNNFLEGDSRTIQKEKKTLDRKRLDLDACKSRVKKARSMESRIEAEAELRNFQTEFDRQQEIIKLLLAGTRNAQVNHTQCLIKFVDAQTEYYANCYQHMKQLNEDLSSMDVYGCSSGMIENDATASSSPENRRKPSKARVLYDYDAADTTELSLLADEIITIDGIPVEGQTWVMGTRFGEHGKVPVNYITIIQDSN